MTPETIRWYLERVNAYLENPQEARRKYHLSPETFLEILRDGLGIEDLAEAKDTLEKIISGALTVQNVPNPEVLKQWQEELEKAQKERKEINEKVIQAIRINIEKLKRQQMMAERLQALLEKKSKALAEEPQTAQEISSKIQTTILPHFPEELKELTPEKYFEILNNLRPQFDQLLRKKGVFLPPAEIEAFAQEAAQTTFEDAVFLVRAEVAAAIEVSPVAEGIPETPPVIPLAGPAKPRLVPQPPAAKKEEILFTPEVKEKFAGEEEGLALTPLYALFNPGAAFSFVKKLVLAPIVKPLQFLDILAGDALGGEAVEQWREKLHKGVTSQDYVASIEVLEEAGVSPEHPQVKELEKKRAAARTYEQAHPRLTGLLKDYHEFTKITGHRQIFSEELKTFLSRLSPPPSWFSKLGKVSYSLRLKRFLDNLGSRLFFYEKKTLVSGKTVIYFALPDKLTRLVTLGRVQSFAALKTLIASKTIKPLAAALGKTAVGQAVKKGAAWLVTRLGLAAIPTGVTQAIAVGWVAPDAIRFFFSKRGREVLKKVLLVGLGAVLAIGGLLVAFPLSLLFFGASVFILGTAFWGPTFLVGIVAGAGTLASQTTSVLIGIFVAITTPIVGTLGALAATVTILFIAALSFFIVIVAAAAFILPKGPELRPSSDFIIITKSVSVGGISNQTSFPNSVVDNRELVEYQLAVEAKDKTLTDIKVVEVISVTSQLGGSFTVTHGADGKPIGPWDQNNEPELAKLESGQRWTKSYSFRLNEEKFKDSIISNTVTVTTAEGESRSLSLSFAIGSPPASSCPVRGGTITCASYGNATYSCQHGTNSYWGNLGLSCEAYPIGGCTCGACPGYGYAIDVSAPANTPVYLPAIYGKILNWSFVNEYKSRLGWGFGRYYMARDGLDTYTLLLAHLNGGEGQVTDVPSGTQVGSIYKTESHVHIELQINSTYVMPEFLCQ